MGGVGKPAPDDLFTVSTHRVADHPRQIDILLREPWDKAIEEPQQVMRDEDLAIAIGPSPRSEERRVGKECRL